MEKILFINGSPNRDGNTAALAKVLLEGRKYETINLNDYRLNFYGQKLEGDQLDEVIAKMKEADIVVMGSPVYWHNICASVRTLMERFYGYVPDGEFKGKRLRGDAAENQEAQNGHTAVDDLLLPNQRLPTLKHLQPSSSGQAPEWTPDAPCPPEAA